MTHALGRVLVVMPALNEETTVGEVVAQAHAAGYPACVVDDGSTDATAERAEAAGATVLRLPMNLGVGGALRCGFRYAISAGYDVVVQVDADGQHDPTTVHALLDHMHSTGADIVIGSRFKNPAEGYRVGLARRLAMRMLAGRVSLSARQRITDATSGLRAIRRPLLVEFAANYPVEYLGDTVEALVLAGRRGAIISECPVGMTRREAGRPSAGALASVWYVLRVLLAIELMKHRRGELPRTLPAGDAHP